MSAIVFDLDGTLVDSAPDIHAALSGALDALGAPPVTQAQTASFVGRGAPVLVAQARAALGLDEVVQAPLLEAFLDRYEDAVDLTRVYPGVPAALDALAARGHRLGLCTNKPIGPTRNVLAHFDLARRMDAVIGGDSLDVRKPDPAPLREVMRRMKVAECLFVGDSETDCETALAAGMPFLLFTQGYRKSDIADMPHAASFDDWAILPDLVAERVGG